MRLLCNKSGIECLILINSAAKEEREGEKRRNHSKKSLNWSAIAVEKWEESKGKGKT